MRSIKRRSTRRVPRRPRPRGGPGFAAVVVGLVVVGGCAPAVQHGPWVYQGTSGGYRGGGTVSTGYGEDYSGPALSFDGAIRWGHVPEDSTRSAVAAGLQTSIFALFVAPQAEDPSALASLVAVDVYAAVPRSTRRATAVGVSASAWHLMPYVQVGPRDPSKGGWFTTQAILFSPTPGFGERDDGTLYWFPSFTRVDPDSRGRGRASHFSVGAGVGRRDGRTVLLLTAGAGMEFFHRDARVR